MSRLNGRRAEAEAQGLRVNVAILGAGRIAHSMARTLVAMAADPRYAGLVAPYAVAARDRGRAAAFAAEYGFPVSYGSYDELLADPDVDPGVYRHAAQPARRAGHRLPEGRQEHPGRKSFTAKTPRRPVRCSMRPTAAVCLVHGLSGRATCRHGPSSTGSWTPARSASTAVDFGEPVLSGVGQGV